MSGIWQLRGRVIVLDRPIVMGILNVTPDSFSDGGAHYATEDAVTRAHAMIREGADIIDVGGESTRPQGATPVSAAEEIDRVAPVIRRIVAEAPGVVVSVDTVKSTTALAALEAGAHLVNDVSAFRLDAEMAGVCAAAGAGVVLMHSRGGVSDMATYAHADYADVTADVVAELAQQVDVALRAGIRSECIVLDPGIGFSKRSEHSLRVLGELDRVAHLGFPMMIGVSRKRFIGGLTQRTVPSERVFGSVGAAVAAYERGARIFRVHDVAATCEALRVAAAIHAAGAV